MLVLNPSDLATRIKIWTPQQMRKRLIIALPQVKAGNTSENIPNEIRQSYIFSIEQKRLLKRYITI